MSEKFSLIFWFKRLLSSAWRKCKPCTAWLDERLEKLWEIGKREIKQSRFFFLALAIGVFIIFALLAGGSDVVFRWLTITAGVIALVLAGWRSSVATRQEENTREQIEKTKEQIEIVTKGQLSDRFAKAVELTSNNNLSIRLGGLAALQSLAEENFDERKRVFTYLCHFLRHPPDLEGWTSNLEKGETQRSSDQPPILFGQRPDIDEICQMIYERKKKYGTEKIVLNLSQACLRGANLGMADLQEANLVKANLREAVLWISSLQEARLWGADLQGADLGAANLQNTNLQDANLRGANLQNTKLQGAVLRGVNLRGANLQDAILQRDDLKDTILRTELKCASFSNALFGSVSSNKRQDLSAFKDPEQLKETFYDKDSPEPILDENLEGKLDRSIHLIPVSIEEWLSHLRTKPLTFLSPW